LFFLITRRSPSSTLFPYTTLFRSLDPLHEEPLKLLPYEIREKALTNLKLGNDQYPIRIKGELNPASRHIFRLLMEHYKGDLNRVDRKSTRLNSSHVKISYAVFCLK